MNIIQPMQCSVFDPEKLKYPVTVQPKLDGICCIVHPSGILQTRQGKIWLCGVLPFLDILRPEFPLVGELWDYYGKNGVQYVQELAAVNRVTPHKDVFLLRYTVFDIVHSEPLYEKRIEFFDSHNEQVRLTDYKTFHKTFNTLDDIYTEHKNNLKLGFEGSIIRNDFCPYEQGVKSQNQFKLKPTSTAEGYIVIVEKGAGKHSRRAGSVLLFSSELDVYVKVAGFDNATLEDLWDNRKKHEAQRTLVTFAYDSLSKNGIPLKPRAVAVRNYE